MAKVRDLIGNRKEVYSLSVDDTVHRAAAHRIWEHDQRLLETAQGFYARVATRAAAAHSWTDADHLLREARPQLGLDAQTWERVRAAHAGHQLGLDILALLPLIGETVGFYDLALAEDLSVVIPERLLDPGHQEAMRKVLAPPPATRADEIVAAMGGTYYAQEAPGLPAFVTRGSHFEKGDPLYVIEVMKMFNKVVAPFAGTIDEVLVQTSGVVVRKGQPLFKITPDERIVEEDPDARERRLRATTDRYLRAL